MVTNELHNHWTNQLNIIQKLTDAPIVFIARFNGANATIISSTPSELPYKIGTELDVNDYYLNNLINDPKPLLINNNLDNDADKLDHVNGFQSFMGYPLFRNNGALWGALVCLSDLNAAFTNDGLNEISVFQKIISDQIELQETQVKRRENLEFLKENRALNYLLDTMNGVPWRLNLSTGAFTYLGRQAKKILGYSHEDWPTIKEWNNSIHQEERAWALNYCNMRTKEGLDHEFEYRMVKKNGNIISIKDVVSVVLDENNKPKELIGFMMDVTDFKKQQSDLQKLNEDLIHEKTLFQTFIDSIPSFVYLKDSSGKLLFANKFYKNFLHNHLHHQLKKVNAKSTFVSEEGMVIEKLENTVLKTHQILNNELFFKDKKGKEYWFHFSFFPIDNASSKVKALGCTSIDITEHKLIEQENEILKNRLEFSMKSGQIAYVEYDTKSEIFSTNSLCQKLTGFNLNGVSPDINWFISRIHPEDVEGLRLGLSNLISEQEEILNIDFRFLNAEQNYIWLHYSGTVELRNSVVEKYIGVFYDISEQKKLLKKVTKESKRALKANQSKTSFLANMSHEIRTPMNAIIGFSQLLSKHIEDPKLKNYTDSIKASGKILMELINDLLDLSKIEAGKMQLKPESVSISELLWEVEQMFANQIQEKGLVLKNELEDNLPYFIYIDPLKIRQILLNLVNNAIKFTPKGTITIHSSFKANQDLRKGSLMLSVSDTGIGIDKENQDLVFDSFVQDESLDKKKFKGTGLGLSIIKDLVALMGGKISLNSQKNIGSTFTVLVPDVTIIDHKQQTIPGEKLKDITFNQELILVVDDIASNRDVLKAFAKDLNLKCIVAENGHQVLTMVEAHHPDIVFLDLRMPDMNGFKVLEDLRANVKYKDIPVIAISAYINDAEEKELLNAGFDGFMKKPFLESEIRSELARFLPYHLMTSANTPHEAPQIIQFSVADEKRVALTERFQSVVLPLWESLKIIQPSDKLILFVEEIKQIAHEYNWDELGYYCKQLDQSIHSFDFETIGKLMKRFAYFVDLLKGFN